MENIIYFIGGFVICFSLFIVFAIIRNKKNNNITFDDLKRYMNND